MTTAAQDHIADARLELWHGRPEPDTTTAWEATDENQIEVTALPALLRLWPLTARMPDSYLEIDEAGPYAVRAHVTGQAELAALRPWREIREIPRGVERWLFQVWRTGGL